VERLSAILLNHRPNPGFDEDDTFSIAAQAAAIAPSNNGHLEKTTQLQLTYFILFN
jgi:hypothetical protein